MRVYFLMLQCSEFNLSNTISDNWVKEINIKKLIMLWICNLSITSHTNNRHNHCNRPQTRKTGEIGTNQNIFREIKAPRRKDSYDRFLLQWNSNCHVEKKKSWNQCNYPRCRNSYPTQVTYWICGKKWHISKEWWLRFTKN